MTVISDEIRTSRRARAGISPGNINRLQTEDRAAHDWYRFVLSFPPHLINLQKTFGVGLTLQSGCHSGFSMIAWRKDA